MNDLAVVSCVWQRPEQLPRLLQQLTAQTCTGFEVYLINNNAALHDVVCEMAISYRDNFPILHFTNDTNRGPFARIELMYSLRKRYAYFMTIDDDALFGPKLLETWWQKRNPAALQGWTGFRFTGNYWQRDVVRPGETCHYLWGSNLFVPVAAVEDERVLDPGFECGGQLDDLWLCYHANHVAGLQLRAQQVDMRIDIDGKDTYHSVADKKVAFLEELRRRGWQV
jgi:hypothetical protein